MRRKPFWLILIVTLLLLTIIPPVYSSEFAVNTVEEDQINPAIAFNSDAEEFLVVWEDYAWQSIGTLGIAAQRIGSNGNILGEAFPAVGEWFSFRPFKNPDIVYNPTAHEYLLVWEYGQSSDDHHIYAIRLASNGAVIGNDHIHIAASTSKFESNPKVAYNPTDNEYLIVWQERNIPIGYEYCLTKISGQRLSSNGSILGPHININNDFTDQFCPAVAFGTTNGQYLIVWEENQMDGADETDIYGQRIGRTGALAGGKIAVSTYVYDQIKPSLAYNNKTNDFLVVWEDHQGDWGSDRDILGQRVTAGGIPQGGNFLISWEGDDFRYSPDIVYNPGIDEYMVTWDYEEHYGNSSIYQRRLSSSGTRIGDEVIVSSQSTFQSNPTIAPSDTSYLIVWEDGRNFFTTMGIDLYGSLIQLQMLSGHVYVGNIGDEGITLSNVALDLYCSNSSGQLGSLLANTLTDSTGSYGIMLEQVCEYYNIIETDPTGYISTGASSIGGRVINDNWIELTHPLSVSEMRDNDFWDISDPPPGNWTNFSPSDWVTTQTVTCTVTVEDIGSGLDVSTGQYAYNKNSSWSTWKTASCTGSDGTTDPRTISAAGVPFTHDSTTISPNLIKFRISDMGGNVAESNAFNVYIDTTAPTNPTLTADRDTNTWSEDADITITWSGASDASSGIEKYFYQWSNSPTTIPDETLSTTSTTLSTTIPAEGDNSYFHLITLDKAGNRATTAAHLGPFNLDTGPPEIISGPTVSSLTQYSALISWQTTEDSDSVLHYSKTAGRYNLQETDATLVTDHSISLTNLAPSTTYRLMVQSTDASGKKTESRGITFETLALTDSTNPYVSLIDPGVCRGVVTISANASDDKGVECVVFSFDGDIIGIDYTPPYQILVDSEKLLNKDYIITAKAIDFSGRSAIDDLKRPVDNLKDMLPPTVEIISPQDGDTVSGEKVAVFVNAEDDSDWCKMEFLLDEKPITFWYERVIPVLPGPGTETDRIGGKSLSLDLTHGPHWTFFWDSRIYNNGLHTLKVRAMDKYGNTGEDIVNLNTDNSDLSPYWNRPKLEITEHEVTRVDNYLELSLRVENIGGMTARNIRIEESLKAFQAAWIYNSSSYHIAYDTSVKEGSFVINEDFLGGSPYDYTIYIVPVLIHPNPPTPSIGDYIDLSYQGEDGSQYNENLSEFISDIETIYDDAVKEADYLIVTNPAQLFSHNNNDIDVHTLLSDMARLAKKRNGVLGYMDTNDGQILKYLISWFDPDAYYECVWDNTCTLSNPGTDWSRKLSSKFSDPLGGYLLIVGEEEIVPAFTSRGFDLSWSNATYNTTCAPFSDHYYGEFNCAKPFRIVGRIIGRIAADLSKAINASMDHGFKRSSALLVSGTDSDADMQEQFTDNIDEIEDKIQNEFNVKKIHWKDFSTHADRFQAFKNNAQDKDVIFYSGHGGVDSWVGGLSSRYELVDSSGNPIIKNDFPVNLGNTSPFVLALSCLTGCYEDFPDGIDSTDFDEWQIGDFDCIAEKFFDSGASVYIGATQVSEMSCSSEAGNWFFNNWDADEDIGTVFTQLEREYFTSDKDDYWCLWVWEYNLYGDPKFGKLTSTKEQKQKERAKRQTPTPSLDIEIPDYVVSSRHNLDYVDIPGGLILLKEGKYRIPYYTTSIDYPRGYRVQDVTLTDMSGLVTDTGLNLPITTMQRGDPGGKINRNSTPPAGWFPELTKQYEWNLIENPNSSTLIITMYPFYYNGQSTDIQFYKNYSFTIDYILSDVKITYLRTDRSAYPQGDPVQMNMGINNGGNPQDVIVSAIIKPYASDNMVDSLPLSTLKNLSNYGSFSDQWDSSGFEPGYYAVEVTIKDTGNNILDKKTRMFRLDISSGEVMSLAANPGHFDIGDSVNLSMTFKDTGTIPITGTAITRVKDKSGNTVKEFKHPVTNLTPTNSITFDDTWDTTNEQEGVYSIFGYVLFDGKSSEPMATTVSSLCDGDVAPLGNRDGTVNVGDALVALRFALGLETPTQEDMGHGDVAPLDAGGQPSPDGVINVGDALVILRKALGIVGF